MGQFVLGLVAGIAIGGFAGWLVSRPADSNAGAAGGSEAGAALARLTAAERRLAQAESELARLRGERQPFPPGLDARHTEAGLLARYADSFREARIEGEVLAIDCSEYPCIVEGRVRSAERGGEGAWRALQAALEAGSDPGWLTCATASKETGDPSAWTFTVAHCAATKGPGADRILRE